MKMHVFIPIFALKLLILASPLWASLLCDSLRAQNASEESGDRFINALFQSKDVELPEDFLVKVSGEKLQVALVTAGVMGTQPSTANLLVRLFDSHGGEKTATTDQRGIAEFVGVQENEMHALLVAEERVHAALPLMTVNSEYVSRTNIDNSQFKLSVGPANAREILASIDNNIPPPDGAAGEVFELSEYGSNKANIYKVHLQQDGSLLGRVVVIDRELARRLRNANLTFLQSNKVVGRTNSNPTDGSFDVPGLKVGTHTVIAAGPAGYASFAFEVLPAVRNRQAEIGIDVIGRPVSFVETVEEERLYVCLCPPRVMPQITERIRQVYSNVDTIGSGAVDGSGAALANSGNMGGYGGFGSAGFGPGFGGGGFGGGGFGGGGFGALAGIAGLSAVAGILAADDNDDDVVSPIVVNQ